MPEMPDVQVFAGNLNKLFAKKKLLEVAVVNGKKLPDKAAVLSKRLTGKKLKSIYRSGKEMRFEFSDGTLLGLHLMLTGDIFVFEKTNDHHSTIVELYFEGGKNMALTDRMRNANIKLDPVDKEGVDVLELTLPYMREIFQRKTAVKNILLDQDLIRGIGNSYSDEILWETRISPYAVASAVPEEKLKELVKTIPKLLKAESKRIDKAHPGSVNDEAKEFLKIHTKTKDKSPTGRPIIIDTKGSRKTYYTDEQVLYK